MINIQKSSFRLVLLFLFTSISFPGKTGILIVKNHQSAYSIIIPVKPVSQEIRAAEILQHYIFRLSACRLQIVHSDTGINEKAIFIRSSPEVHDPDGFMIRTTGNQLFITGGTDKGPIYGVIDLLEKQLGCRRFSVRDEIIPQPDSVYLPDLNYQDAPANTLRIINGNFCLDQDYKDWLRLDLTEEVFADGYYVHTFQRLIPWAEYFDEHPEYFALMNGKRIIDQPCLSNQAVLQITLDKLRKEMQRQPEKQVWSVSQNDNFSYCQCDQCKQIINTERSPAGPIIRFVNMVAKEFPGKTISTLAYQYSRQAPVVTKPRENVQVMLCTIELNRSKSIADDTGSISFIQDMTDWGKICDHIYLWDYTVNFSHHIAPFPNLHVLQPNIRLFTSHNIHEHFQQSNTGNGHEFSELKSYLIARLLWDPEVNADSVLAGFLQGYYGAAAPWMGQYIRRLTDEMVKSGERLDIYEHPTAHQNSVLSLRNTSEFSRLFDLAENAAMNDPVCLLHVRTARLPLQYAIMEIGKNNMFGPRGWYTEQGDDFILHHEMAEQLEEFYSVCVKAKVQSLNESGLTPQEYYEATRRFIDVQVKGNKAFRKKVAAVPLPAVKYSQGDLAVLTNGVFGANDFKAHWLGWEGENFILTLDLEQVQNIDTIRISTLCESKSWIFHPAAIACYISENGTDYQLVAKKSVEGDQRNEPVTRSFSFCPNQVPLRFVRFDVTGLLKNPDWHPSAGGGCWVFVDEVVCFAGKWRKN